MPFDVRMEWPASGICAGSSGSGKTTLIWKLLSGRKKMFKVKVDKVVFYYTQYQTNMFKQMLADDSVHQFIEGMPTIDDIKSLTSNAAKKVLIVIDDNMKNVNSDLSEIFTTFRHRNASVFFLTQNLFHQHKDYRTMSLNANYIIIMKNPRDQSQIMNFAKQFSPNDTKYVTDAFKKATANRPFSYMFFDLRQETNDCLRMRTNIFEDEWPMSVFMKDM